MSTELIPTDQQAALAAVQQVAKDYGLAAIEKADELQRTLMLATGTAKLKSLLTKEVMQPIMALQGSTLGFRTDQDLAGGYSLEVVRDVTAEALLRGFRVIGNEVNIIAGRFYAAKDGCKRRVVEWPGLTEFSLELSYPTNTGGTAYVEGLATWNLNGVADQLERRGKTAIPVRRNANMLDDAILGKAERKMYAAVLNKLSTFVIPDGEVDADAVDATSRPVSSRRSSLNDFVDATPKAPSEEKPAFDPEQDALVIDGFRSQLDSADDSASISAVQKDAAKWTAEKRLSPAGLLQVNILASRRRAAIRGKRGERANQRSFTEPETAAETF